MFPDAPVFTSIYWPEALPSAYRDWDIRTSFLDRLPLIHSHHQWYLPLYPYGFEQFDLSEYDLVLSVTSAFGHGVVTGPDTTHLCYCLTPARFLWGAHAYMAREELGPAARAVIPVFLHRLRQWDRLAADRVDQFIAISNAVQSRIKKHYHRDSGVIYPPVDAQRFRPSDEHDDYFLILSRLVPYKRIDLAVRAFSQLGLPLVVIGDGRDRRALQDMAAENVRFMGRVSDEECNRYLSRCRAFVFPGEEDFGITPLEAQAAGRPVIAFAGGGALETIIEGQTGAFFREATPESLAQAVSDFDDGDYDPVAIRQHALRFDRSVFETALRKRIQQCKFGAGG